MKTPLELLQHYMREYQLNQDVTERDIQEIIAFVLNINSADLFINLHQEITSEALEEVDALLKIKATGKPLAYVLGFVEFYGCRIFVDERVLIPRVETEILLDKVLERIKNKTLGCAYDLCCGSGCLGIGLKKQRPECEVYLADISEKALEVAKYNASTNQTEVTCLQGDFLEAFRGVPKADLVLCNPPYISEQDYKTLEKSVKDFEPKLALTADVEGLEFFKKLSCQLPQYLNAGALVALEIGFNQKKAVIEMFSIAPWKSVCCERDYAGLDRFIFLEVE